MCTVSMVGDFYKDKWSDPSQWPSTSPINPFPNVNPYYQYPPQPLTNDQIVRKAVELTQFYENAHLMRAEDLKRIAERIVTLEREVADMKNLLARAKKYDEDNNEPHCETEDKMDLLRRVASAFGVDLSSIIGEK